MDSKTHLQTIRKRTTTQPTRRRPNQRNLTTVHGLTATRLSHAPPTWPVMSALMEVNAPTLVLKRAVGNIFLDQMFSRSTSGSTTSTRSGNARQNRCRINQRLPRKPRRIQATQSHGHRRSCLQWITSQSLPQILSDFHKLKDRCSHHPTHPTTTPVCRTRTSIHTSNTETSMLTS